MKSESQNVALGVDAFWIFCVYFRKPSENDHIFFRLGLFFVHTLPHDGKLKLHNFIFLFIVLLRSNSLPPPPPFALRHPLLFLIHEIIFSAVPSLYVPPPKVNSPLTCNGFPPLASYGVPVIPPASPLVLPEPSYQSVVPTTSVPHTQ